MAPTLRLQTPYSRTVRPQRMVVVKTLGVAPGADATHIKTAYRKLALKLHPDVNHAPDASTRFMEVQAAYDELCKADEAQAWQASPNHGQRGCRATWERQVAGVHALVVGKQLYGLVVAPCGTPGLHQRPRSAPWGKTRETNLAAQLAGLHRRRHAAGRA